MHLDVFCADRVRDACCVRTCCATVCDALLPQCKPRRVCVCGGGVPTVAGEKPCAAQATFQMPGRITGIVLMPFSNSVSTQKWKPRGWNKCSDSRKMCSRNHMFRYTFSIRLPQRKYPKWCPRDRRSARTLTSCVQETICVAMRFQYVCPRVCAPNGAPGVELVLGLSQDVFKKSYVSLCVFNTFAPAFVQTSVPQGSN
jgi:hypothetical protein